MDFSITPSALQKLKEVATQESVNLNETYLRVAVLSGGCSGLTYDLGWDSALQPQDEVAEVNGLKIIADFKAVLYMDGTELDFSDGLEGKGFHFKNPQATRTCACGESFSV